MGPIIARWIKVLLLCAAIIVGIPLGAWIRVWWIQWMMN